MPCWPITAKPSRPAVSTSRARPSISGWPTSRSPSCATPPSGCGVEGWDTIPIPPTTSCTSIPAGCAAGSGPALRARCEVQGLIQPLVVPVDVLRKTYPAVRVAHRLRVEDHHGQRTREGKPARDLGLVLHGFHDPFPRPLRLVPQHPFGQTHRVFHPH